MPWWGYVIIGGGLLVWASLVALICLFFRGAKKLNDRFDREQDERLRRTSPTYRAMHRG